MLIFLDLSHAVRSGKLHQQVIDTGDCFQRSKGWSVEHNVESQWLIDHQKVVHYTRLSWVVSQSHGK